MESGLSSAYAIASISEKRFMKMYGDALGGEQYTCVVHQKASYINTRTEHIATAIQEMPHTAKPQFVISEAEYGRPLPPKFGPYVIPDEELKKISTPTLLIIGEQEIIYDAEQAIKRAEELVANIQTAIIPNASHMVNIEQTELVNSHILKFLSGNN